MVLFSRVATVPAHLPALVAKNYIWKVAVLGLLILWLYAAVLARLVEQWWTDSNCSHGFLVPPFVAFVIWLNRKPLAQLPDAPAIGGLLIVIIALVVLFVGVLGSELFFSRVSLLLLIAGLAIYFRGWRFFRGVLFPWCLLFLMIPIPAIIFNQVTFPLQMFASRIAAAGLSELAVPVLREGNIINLPSMPLEVAEACSGIRSLLSLVTLGIIYGYLKETRIWIRILLTIAAIPIAVVANSLRIIGTGLLTEYWGPAAAEGFFHSFSGWLIFIASLGGLILLHSGLRLFARLERSRI
jgi:exosortase